VKIAILGSGISGLVAAHRLAGEHDVTIFEANTYAGGHINTVEVDVAGERHWIDTGFIVFNDWTYPNFVRLLAELEVESQVSPMSFSVRDDRRDLEYNGHSPNTVFAQRRNLVRPRFYRMLIDIARFNASAYQTAQNGDDETTVGEFLARQRYSTEFADHYLLPMGSAIWSCPRGTFAEFPIRFVTEFYRHHGLLSLWRRPTWRVVRGGSRTYVQAILARFRGRLRLNSHVQRVRRRPDTVEVHWRDHCQENFDHVVFACHSDQALSILGQGATATERATLSAFPYGRNVAVLHTDTSLLPRRRRAWASWNYRIAHEAPAAAMVTYNMNLLQGIRSPRTFCVTLNGEALVDRRSVLRRFVYEHPVFTTRRAEAQARHAQLIGANRSSFCGAYWGNGFHEDGVVSALAVVDLLRRQSATDKGRRVASLRPATDRSQLAPTPTTGRIV
jgi:predicted NAD/FAD-binding protein